MIRYLIVIIILFGSLIVRANQVILISDNNYQTEFKSLSNIDNPFNKNNNYEEKIIKIINKLPTEFKLLNHFYKKVFLFNPLKIFFDKFPVLEISFIESAVYILIKQLRN